MQRRRARLAHEPVPDWIAQPERGSRLALLAYVRLALALGRPAARVILYPVCLYFLVFAFKARAASRRYLRKALAREPRAADLYRHFHTFASTILDRVFLLKGRYSAFEVRTHGEDIVADVVERGGGCFLVGAHMGSFEVVRALGGDAHGLRVSLVMYEENARKVASVLNAIKPDRAPRIIALGQMDAMLKVEQALERGEFVGMLADRTIAGEGTIACSFMGEDARFPLGPFRLAAMLERPIVLMFGLYRGGNRYDIHFERLEVAPGRPDRKALVEQSLRSYVARLEHYCRLAPYNWFNFYDYWEKARNEDRTLRARFARALTVTTCLIALSCASSLSAHSAESAGATAWGLEQLMHRLGQVRRVEARFVERKHLRILEAPIEFAGTLTYKAPGYLEKHTLLPKPQKLVLDHDRLLVEDAKQRRTLRLQDYPVVWAFVESIRATLAGDLKALQGFYSVDLEGNEGEWRLSLKPIEPSLQSMVNEIRISGQRDSIRVIEVVEGEGDRSVMTITAKPR